MIAVGAVALLAGLIAVLLVAGGGGGSWPASVTTVQAEIKQACENPDVAAEPSGLNFACGKDTQQVLWVFSLLTSGDNPGFVDQSTGRKGLEPIQPSQGGDIAWSLNLHHPYNAAQPDRQPSGRGAGHQQHHQRRDADVDERRRARGARPGEQGGQLPALHRLAEARHPVRGTLPGAPRRSAAPRARRRW